MMKVTLKNGTVYCGEILRKSRNVTKMQDLKLGLTIFPTYAIDTVDAVMVDPR